MKTWLKRHSEIVKWAESYAAQPEDERTGGLYHEMLYGLADSYVALREAVNEYGREGPECLEGCDSYGHEEKCKHVDLAYMVEYQQMVIADLRAKLGDTKLPLCDKCGHLHWSGYTTICTEDCKVCEGTLSP